LIIGENKRKRKEKKRECDKLVLNKLIKYPVWFYFQLRKML